MMVGLTSLLPFTLLGCLVQANHMPSKTDLCGLLVDSELEKECLACFTEAGEVSKFPEKVRKCVGTYMPPIAADCSVPHVDNNKGSRMGQGLPDVHHNHTNANLLPNCLKRKMRVLSRYLAAELRFTKQAGGMVKAVVGSKLVKNGGPTMLSARAMKSIIDLPQVKVLLEKDSGASQCFSRYPENSGDCRMKSRTEDNVEDLLALLRKYDNDELEDEENESEEDSEAEFEEENDDDNNGGEYLEGRKYRGGNKLPFGGTNCLARVSLLGECLISAMVDSGSAKDLLTIVTKDTFFYPIPQWWVEPLLRIAKAA